MNGREHPVRRQRSGTARSLMVVRLKLFWRLLIRPLVDEPVRTALTVLAVALGVAVVLAMDLAGEAATGSFHSSLETISGQQDFEITAAGGVPERLVGKLALEPYDWKITPRIEGFAQATDSKQTFAVLGLDLIAQSNRAQAPDAKSKPQDAFFDPREFSLEDFTKPDSIWVGQSLHKTRGEVLRLLLNDRALTFTVRGSFADEPSAGSAIVMDIASAQTALGRTGCLDRLFVRLPRETGIPVTEWQRRLQQILPEGVQLRPAGAATDENRKMLAAFRWNLRLLSYIALIVGAFLIYNSISVSVVRRRAEIGIVRALGASRADVLAAFLLEAGFIGLSGSLLGLPLGRFMATSAVKLMGNTVNALYVSSRPGEIALSTASVVLALLTGLMAALLSAWGPAREAALVAPVEAMARGRREYSVRARKGFSLWIAASLVLASAITSRLPPVGGKPVFGYCAALLAVAAAVFAVPAFVEAAMRASSHLFSKLFGVEALLASRSLSGSLRRTSVLVAALSTAVAMMTAVGIMVGSFRQTVVAWMASELPADLYLRAAGSPATDQHPTISPSFSEELAKLQGIRSVQRLRAYEISYEGKPATLASVDLSDPGVEHTSDFLSGRTADTVLPELRGANAVIVSEPFAYKHHLHRGDAIQLSLGESRTTFRVADIFYDYASERGMILMDRNVMLRFLPDPAPSNIAVFVAADVSPSEVRPEIERAAASSGAHILIFLNHDLRRQAVQIFDRTFAITYALEAIAVLVAVMGVAGALLALVIDRRRELGLLRYLGASSNQLRKMILAEAGMLGLLANVAGLLLGFGLSLILIFVINKQSFGWTIRLHWPVAVLLAGLSLMWIATFLAGCYPARIAVRLNPMEVIHED
jgi:putative ABC transport system permease protein